MMLFLPGPVFAQSKADKIVGNWTNEEADARFVIAKAGDTYSAKITWLSQPNEVSGAPKTDKHNPDKNLRARHIIGIDIFTQLKFDNGIWDGTDVYSPEKGIYAKLKIELVDDNHLKIIGSKGVFSSTKTWVRL